MLCAGTCPGQVEVSANVGFSELVQTLTVQKLVNCPRFLKENCKDTPNKCLLQSGKDGEEFLRKKLLELFNLAGECYFCFYPHPRKGQVILDIN